jgi:hypothetical protein
MVASSSTPHALASEPQSPEATWNLGRRSSPDLAIPILSGHGSSLPTFGRLVATLPCDESIAASPMAPSPSSKDGAPIYRVTHAERTSAATGPTSPCNRWAITSPLLLFPAAGYKWTGEYWAKPLPSGLVESVNGCRNIWHAFLRPAGSCSDAKSGRTPAALVVMLPTKTVITFCSAQPPPCAPNGQRHSTFSRPSCKNMGPIRT